MMKPPDVKAPAADTTLPAVAWNPDCPLNNLDNCLWRIQVAADCLLD